jgi:head-tail adaptor
MNSLELARFLKNIRIQLKDLHIDPTDKENEKESIKRLQATIDKIESDHRIEVENEMSRELNIHEFAKSPGITSALPL